MNDISELVTLAADATEVLSRWDGCVCQLWSYGASHPTFCFRIYRTGRPTSLTMECISPGHYHGSTGWGRCRLRVTAEEAAPLNLLVVSDETAGFRLQCRYLRLREDPPPHWLRVDADAGAAG
jgi:hypothetical protein